MKLLCNLFLALLALGPTHIQGTWGVETGSQDRRPKTWRDTIMYLDPDRTLFTQMLLRLGAKKVSDPEFKLFEKEFHNSITSVEFGYDNRAGKSVFVEFGTGRNFDSDLQLVTLEAEYRISSAWGLQYEVTWLELDPDPELESTWIHVFQTSYYFTNDLFVSLFVQTNSVISKENVQLLGVWRFKPPFGSLQLAYQRGTSEFGEPSEQGDTVFTKLSWVF